MNLYNEALTAAAEESDILRRAIMEAYGLLWMTKTDNKRVHAARRRLLKHLSKQQQMQGIALARVADSASQSQSD